MPTPIIITPLPRRRLFIVSCIQLSEAVAITQILPYVAFMVQDFLAPTTDANFKLGLYTGVVVVAFTFTEYLSSFAWLYVSNRIGRRPVIVAGCVGNVIALPLFGLSRSLSFAIAVRALAGLLNGNTGVLKTYLGECTDKTNQDKAFRILSLSHALGLVIGPVIGGMLFNPAAAYPQMFSHDFFHENPYLLPNLASIFGSVLALLAGACCLPETNNALKSNRLDSITSMDSVLVGILEKKALYVQKSSFAILLDNSNFVISCTYYVTMSFAAVGYETIYPLWAKVDEATFSGWEWGTGRIGVVKSFAGIGMFLMQGLLYHRLVNMVGLRKVVRIAWLIFSLLWLVYPLFQYIKHWEAQVAVLAVFHLVFYSCVSAVMTTSYHIANNSVYNLIRKKANTIVEALSYIARLLGPIGGGVLFSFSLSWEAHSGVTKYIPFTNRYLVFYVMAIMSAIMFIISLKLSKAAEKQKLIK